MILSDALILPVSQPQTQQERTSQIRSYIEYLYRVITFVCSLLVKIYETFSLNDGF